MYRAKTVYFVLCFLLFVACGKEEANAATPQENTGQAFSEDHSGSDEKSNELLRLLNTPFEELSSSDIDRLKLFSSEISPEKYLEQHPEKAALLENNDAKPLATAQVQLEGLVSGQWNTVQIPNDSHCTTTVNRNGTQIQQTEYEVDEFITDLLDSDTQPRSSDEGVNEDDSFFDVLHFFIDLFI